MIDTQNGAIVEILKESENLARAERVINEAENIKKALKGEKIEAGPDNVQAKSLKEKFFEVLSPIFDKSESTPASVKDSEESKENSEIDELLTALVPLIEQRNKELSTEDKDDLKELAEEEQSAALKAQIDGQKSIVQALLKLTNITRTLLEEKEEESRKNEESRKEEGRRTNDNGRDRDSVEPREEVRTHDDDLDYEDFDNFEERRKHPKTLVERVAISSTNKDLVGTQGLFEEFVKLAIERQRWEQAAQVHEIIQKTLTTTPKPEFTDINEYDEDALDDIIELRKKLAEKEAQIKSIKGKNDRRPLKEPEDERAAKGNNREDVDDLEEDRRGPFTEDERKRPQKQLNSRNHRPFSRPNVTDHDDYEDEEHFETKEGQVKNNENKPSRPTPRPTRRPPSTKPTRRTTTEAPVQYEEEYPLEEYVYPEEIEDLEEESPVEEERSESEELKPLVEQRRPFPPRRPFLTDRRPAQEERRPSIEEKRPTFEERKPTLEEKRPTLEERRPTLEEKRPTLEERRPTLEERRPSFEEKRPTLEERRPNIEERRPSLANTRPSFDEKRPKLEERKPTFEEKKPTPEARRPILEERRPTLEEGRPLEEEKPTLEERRPTQEGRRPTEEEIVPIKEENTAGTDESITTSVLSGDNTTPEDRNPSQGEQGQEESAKEVSGTEKAGEDQVEELLKKEIQTSFEDAQRNGLRDLLRPSIKRPSTEIFQDEKTVELSETSDEHSNDSQVSLSRPKSRRPFFVPKRGPRPTATQNLQATTETPQKDQPGLETGRSSLFERTTKPTSSDPTTELAAENTSMDPLRLLEMLVSKAGSSSVKDDLPQTEIARGRLVCYFMVGPLL